MPRNESGPTAGLTPYVPPMTGAQFEAEVTLRTMERVFDMLEQGGSLQYSTWPLDGAKGERIEAVFYRFRALRGLVNDRFRDAFPEAFNAE